MSIPVVQTYRIARYILEQKLKGNKRYPLVLMLEPLFQCNLACSGCGKIDYPDEILRKRMSVEDALNAVDECGAPVVSIPGGEPLIHKEMPQIVEGIIARKKFVYLCTNALLLEQKLDQYTPSPYLTFSVHLDGNKDRHDASVCRDGTFDRAVSAIKAARARGFRVTANCTLYAGEDPEDVANFFDFTNTLGVEGVMMSPGYSYQHAPRQDVFLGRRKSKELFRRSSRSARSAAASGISISRACSSTSSPAIRAISARRGRIPPTTCSAGRSRATCSSTRATPRASRSSWRPRSGTSTASGAIRSATTAWRTAATKARLSSTRSRAR